MVRAPNNRQQAREQSQKNRTGLIISCPTVEGIIAASERSTRPCYARCKCSVRLPGMERYRAPTNGSRQEYVRELAARTKHYFSDIPFTERSSHTPLGSRQRRAVSTLLRCRSGWNRQSLVPTSSCVLSRRFPYYASATNDGHMKVRFQERSE